MKHIRTATAETNVADYDAIITIIVTITNYDLSLNALDRDEVHFSVR